MNAPPTNGRLVVVGTPIGNLGDISTRARESLATADVILCEDTRRTRSLLSALGLPAGTHRLVSLHAHNEAARLDQVREWLARGQAVVVVSDAGMPLVSDPGAAVTAAAIEMGCEVNVVPGPSAVLSALVVSGLPSERFCFEGFLPRKGPARRRRLAELATEGRTTVIFEAPGRLGATLADLVEALGERSVCVARELTKLHQEIWRGSLAGAAATFADREVRGEVVVVLAGAESPSAPDASAVATAVAAALAEGLGARESAQQVAAALGVPRRHAYQVALEQLGRSSAPDEPPSGRR